MAPFWTRLAKSENFHRFELNIFFQVDQDTVISSDADASDHQQVDEPPERADQDPPEMVQVNVAQESPLHFPRESPLLVLDEIFQDRANPPMAETGCLQFDGQDMIMLQIEAGPQPTLSVEEIMPTQLEQSGQQQGQLGEPQVHSCVQAEQIENHWDSKTQNDLDNVPLGPGLVVQQGEAEQEQPQEPLPSTSSSSVSQNLETGQMEVDDDPGNKAFVCKPDV